MYLLHVELDAFKTINHHARLPNPACRKLPFKPTRQVHRSPSRFIMIKDMSMLDHPTRKDSARITEQM
jgi:hypothetical protein